MQLTMKRYLTPILILVIPGLLATPVAAQEPDSRDIDQIRAVLEKHDQALGQHDLQAIMTLFEDTAVLMGTGPGELWEGKDEVGKAYEQFFSDFDAGSLSSECYWRKGDITGDTAWLMSMCKLNDALKGQKREFGLNVSLVLHKSDAGWRVQAMHWSNLTGDAPPAQQ